MKRELQHRNTHLGWTSETNRAENNGLKTTQRRTFTQEAKRNEWIPPWSKMPSGDMVILWEGSGFGIPISVALVMCLPNTVFIDLVRSFNLCKHKYPHLKMEENKLYFMEL